MGLDITEEDVQDMILRADADKDGRVSKDQFFVLMGGMIEA